jgi:hypothetical protein
VKQKFHELLDEYKPKYEVKGTKEVAYVPKKDGNQGGNQGGSDNQGGGNNDQGGNDEIEG